MRHTLQALDHERFTVEATFTRFGTKPGWRGASLRTILLTDVRRAADASLLTDHLWFVCGKTFDRLHLHPGDRIRFDARVTAYEKGYHGRRAEATGEAWSAIDYRLERPTQAHKLPAIATQFPDDSAP